MKITPFLIVTLFANCWGVAQEARYETAAGTNAIQIAEYESGELISVFNTNGANSLAAPSLVSAQKGNLVFQLKSSASFQHAVYNGNTSAGSGIGDVIRGPAAFFVSLANTPYAQGFTIKITPVSFPPNQTLVVPPGTNQVQISMESSTNLVNWMAATNGVYGSPESAHFFRMRMTTLQP